jgi:hypothetical protein
MEDRMTAVDVPAVDVSALLARLDEIRQESHQLFAGIAEDALIYPESDWRFKDIITHLTGWEEEATAALQAHVAGTVYAAPLRDHSDEDLQRYNDGLYQTRKDYSLERVLTDWASAREQFKAAIGDLSAAQWASNVTYPWSAQNTPERLVRGMLWHEGFHRDEVLVAVGHKAPVAAQE